VEGICISSCASNHTQFILCHYCNSPKQGAYGKIKIHKEPLLLSVLLHPDEVIYGILLLVWKFQQGSLSQEFIQQTFPEKEEDLAFCMDILAKVSRSFSTVIRQLPDALMVDVLVFYLILRALDTIEDDPTAFANNPRSKIQLLKTFYQQALPTTTSSAAAKQVPWTLDGVGEGDEKRLLQEFPRVQSIYSCLSDESKAILADITKRMGEGMAETVGKDLTQGTATVEYTTFIAIMSQDL
jgi:farnesyl-diphosphate farnesyltransferase